MLDGGVGRLRPILLTSLTTFFGLMPMFLETSVQARFLIPMAISLGYGVLLVTFIVLLVVPPLYMIIEDLRRLVGLGDDEPGDGGEPPAWKPGPIEQGHGVTGDTVVPPAE